MNTWLLIGLAVAAVWFYGKTAAAKATQAQSPQLTVPQGSIASSILSSLGIAANLVPGQTAASSAAETLAYTAAASTPGSLNVGQITSGQDVGATAQQTAQANAYSQQLNESMGMLPDSVIISSTAQLQPQGDDSTDMSNLQGSGTSFG